MPEAVLDAAQRLDQPRVAVRIADAQAGSGASGLARKPPFSSVFEPILGADNQGPGGSSRRWLCRSAARCPPIGPFSRGSPAIRRGSPRESWAFAPFKGANLLTARQAKFS